jgi:hypothetical protein
MLQIGNINDDNMLQPVEEVPQDLLVNHVRTFFETAKTAKLTIEQDLLQILRQLKGEYDPGLKMALAKAGLPDDFIRLTYHKARDAESWLLNQLNPFGDRTWDVTPSTTIEIPPEIEDALRTQVRQQVLQQAIQQAKVTGQPVDAGAIIQQSGQLEEEVKKKVKDQAKALAEERSTNMEKTILQQLHDGGWQKAFKACINDLSRFKSCIIKGPFFTKEIVPSWKDGKPSTEKQIVYRFARVSPFDWYPSADSIEVDDGDCIELERPTRGGLQKLIGVPGYRDDAIRAALAQYATGYQETNSVDAERFTLEKDSYNGLSESPKLEMLNYWGEVPGKTLLDYGMKPEEIPDPDLDYPVNIKVVGTFCVKASLNPDPFGKKPYGVTSFVKSNDSQWGECPAELMRDLQGICNLAVRSLIQNVGLSSGPLTEMDKDRLAPGESPDIWPHKVILTTNRQMKEGPAVRYYNAPMLAKELLMIYDRFKREADDLVVPSYGPGSQMGKAGNTVQGMSMFMNAANRNIELAIDNVDSDLIIPMIERMFNYNMQYNPDETIKGDLKIKARGSSHQTIKETRVQKLLSILPLTNNEVDMQIIGAKGRAYQWGEVFKSIGIDLNQALPNLEAIEKMPAIGMNPQQQAGGQQTPGKEPEQALDGSKAGGPQEAQVATA